MIPVILILVLMVASVKKPMGATTSSVTAQRVMEDTPVKVYNNGKFKIVALIKLKAIV